MESKMLEDLEEDGRNIYLVLKGMVVKTLGPVTRIKLFLHFPSGTCHYSKGHIKVSAPIWCSAATSR
jgi:hypothetical protein